MVMMGTERRGDVLNRMSRGGFSEQSHATRILSTHFSSLTRTIPGPSLSGTLGFNCVIASIRGALTLRCTIRPAPPFLKP